MPRLWWSEEDAEAAAHSSRAATRTLYHLQLHQLLFGASQLISLFIQSSHHLCEQSEPVCFSKLVLSKCDSGEPLSQDVCLRQEAAKQDE